MLEQQAQQRAENGQQRDLQYFLPPGEVQPQLTQRGRGSWLLLVGFGDQIFSEKR